MDLFAIGHHVSSRDALQMRGMSRASVRVAVSTKRLVRVHHGWYVDAATWRAWYPEQRHAAVAIAVARAQRSGDVLLSHTCAVVLHGLPLYRYTPARAHVTGPGSAGATRARSHPSKSGDGIRAVKGPPVRHAGEIKEHRHVIAGLAVTDLARTVADVIGRLPLPTAVAIADAALRQVALPEGSRDYDAEAAERLRQRILECAALRSGARGSVQARWVAQFADGRAASPGESVSRLYFHQLGFGAPELQARVDHDAGYYEIDFGFEDLGVWGEFDGHRKYLDGDMLDGMSTADALLAEKRREDDIRGRTGRRVIRWESEDIASLETFRKKLASFGICPPGGPGVATPTFRGPKL
ncbi:hypothetical protein IF188_12840 [Microbacterium sp. NEAU-LLC]|uniref:Transcriptional regulator, AbiEi antitoxin, Type IV TA system n=1 Tax=Microbacterium helvum TaxID=2773713 RepID=A0ABR8NPK3_9MICO|nr:hypothetical protein [Microbacterium helvum]MBD3942585.1 hypothetical protein [Microbacterium helvum]